MNQCKNSRYQGPRIADSPVDLLDAWSIEGDFFCSDVWWLNSVFAVHELLCAAMRSPRSRGPLCFGMELTSNHYRSFDTRSDVNPLMPGKMLGRDALGGMIALIFAT